MTFDWLRNMLLAQKFQQKLTICWFGNYRQGKSEESRILDMICLITKTVEI